jgi:hypothetical protein
MVLKTIIQDHHLTAKLLTGVQATTVTIITNEHWDTGERARQKRWLIASGVPVASTGRSSHDHAPGTVLRHPVAAA